MDYSDIAILEYLKDFVYYKDHKSLYVEGQEYIWLNYNHLIDSLPFAYFKSKGTVSRRIEKLRNLGLIITHKAKDNTLYYTFTDKMIDLCFYKKFTPGKQKPRINPAPARRVGASTDKNLPYRLCEGVKRPKQSQIPDCFANARNDKSSVTSVPSVVKESNGFTTMSGNVWKVLSHIRERQLNKNV